MTGPRVRARLGRPLAVLTGAVLLAACGAASSSGPTTTTTSTSTSTTTTTTLPVPTPIGSTDPAGSLASLGPVSRVPVFPVADGALEPTPPPPGPGQDIGAVKVAFRRFGSGPPILLIMGEHGTMTWWDPQLLTSLATKFQVTLFDLPGVGYSAALPAPPTVASYSDATAGLIDALGLMQPVVLGWGLGGQVALALAERHPGIASRLILVDTTAGGTPSAEPKAAVQLLGDETATPTELSRLMFPAADDAARTGWLARIAQLSPDDIVATAIHGEATAEARFLRSTAVPDGLGTISIPCLVVVGADDVVYPEPDSVKLSQKLKDSSLLVLPATGYASLFQQETLFFQDLVSTANP